MTPETTPRKPKRVLISYSMSSSFTNTTMEYLLALKRHTSYDVRYVHVTHDAWMDFDLNEYDVLFQSYCARLCYEGYCSESYRRAVSDFRGLKIISVQDDYDRTSTLVKEIRHLGFHVLLTCIQPEFWPLVYPKAELPGLHLIQGLTGYVPEALGNRARAIVPLRERKTVFAYRSRDINAKFGRLAFEKREIGRRMLEICEARGIPHDIAIDSASRLYGEDWYDFLGRSRVVLGAESASNAFDFDGSLERRHEEVELRLGRPPTYEEFRPYLDPIEKHFNVGQISPRIFECAAMHTPMVLFRGRYSGAIEPDVHYVPLEKDFSNVEQVLDTVNDLDRLEGIADRAYDRLVRSGLFSYASFAGMISRVIEEQHPVFVDDRRLRFLSETAEPWARTPIPEAPSTVTEIRRAVLAERPTDEPEPVALFISKHDRLDARLKEHAAPPAAVPPPEAAAAWTLGHAETETPGNAATVTLGNAVTVTPDDTDANERPLAVRVLRPIWRLLPASLRYSMWRRIHRLARAGG